MMRLLLVIILIVATALPVGADSFIVTKKTPIVLYSSTTVGATGADLTEDDLQTYTMPAGTFSRAGQLLRITFTGSCLSNTDTKLVKLYFGSINTFGVFLSISTALTFTSTAYILNTGSSTQLAYDPALLHGGVPKQGNVIVNLTQTDTAPIIIKVTGQNGVATLGDIANVIMTVELINP